MAKYALIKNSLVENIIIADASMIPEIIAQNSYDEAVDVTNVQAFIGDSYINQVFARSYPPLAEAMGSKLLEIEQTTSAWIQARISPEAQISYVTIMLMAHIDSMPNRLAYVRQLWDWTQAVIGYNIQCLTEVSQLTTSQEVVNYVFDLDSNVPPMPNVDMLTAMQIMD